MNTDSPVYHRSLHTQVVEELDQRRRDTNESHTNLSGIPRLMIQYVHIAMRCVACQQFVITLSANDSKLADIRRQNISVRIGKYGH